MHKNLILSVAAAVLLTTPAAAAPNASEVLRANRASSGEVTRNGNSTLELDYTYAGQGMTGTTRTIEDTAGGRFVDSFAIGPDTGANGFDGSRAWLKEPSGTVTWQGGGDTETLAVNESYRDANLWWRPDFGGASVTYGGQQRDGGRTYDVLTVTPKNGKAFDAWFDFQTHLLARIREVQGTLPITTLYSDYTIINGVELAQRLVVDDSTGAAQRITMKLSRAKASPVLPASQYEPPSQNLHDFGFVGQAKETSVPFKLINNHIYASASVNGSGPLQVLFDTGGHDILTPPTARMLGVKVVGTSTATGGGNSTAISGSARVQSIRIGDAVIRDQPVTVLQFSNPAEGVDEQGMIGYEFFARFVTRIDYGKQTLTFIDAKSFDPKDAGTAVPFRFFQQFPEMLGSYDGIPGRFGIDTGARTPLSLNRIFAEQNHLRERTKAGVVALTGWGVGGPVRSFVTRGGTLDLGDVSIAHPLTEFDLDKGGSGGAVAFPNNVGGGVLKRFVVTLDYAHYRIFFKPITGEVADLDTFDRSGMWINAGPRGFVIVDVTEGGPADRAGLRKGDVITSVDGKPVSSIQLSDFRAALRDETPGTGVALTVKAANGVRSVRISLRDQI